MRCPHKAMMAPEHWERMECDYGSCGLWVADGEYGACAAVVQAVETKEAVKCLQGIFEQLSHIEQRLLQVGS